MDLVEKWTWVVYNQVHTKIYEIINNHIYEISKDAFTSGQDWSATSTLVTISGNQTEFLQSGYPTQDKNFPIPSFFVLEFDIFVNTFFEFI